MLVPNLIYIKHNTITPLGILCEIEAEYKDSVMQLCGEISNIPERVTALRYMQCHIDDMHK